MASLNTRKILQTLHALHVNVDMSKAYIVLTCIMLAVDACMYCELHRLSLYLVYIIVLYAHAMYLAVSPGRQVFFVVSSNFYFDACCQYTVKDY